MLELRWVVTFESYPKDFGCSVDHQRKGWPTPKFWLQLHGLEWEEGPLSRESE